MTDKEKIQLGIELKKILEDTCISLFAKLENVDKFFGAHKQFQRKDVTIGQIFADMSLVELQHIFKSLRNYKYKEDPKPIIESTLQKIKDLNSKYN